jgi:ATPase subunit of ABC transporter with duplicated ATPase domains
MKKSSLILAMIFLIAIPACFQRIEAQEKSKEEREKELQMQEAINEQKKAMIEQQKVLQELQENNKAQQNEMEKAMEDARVKIDEARKNGTFRVYGDRANRAYSFGDEPFVFAAPGVDMFRGYMGDSERTTWDFSKNIKETTFSRDYTFDVEPTVNTVVMAVNGDCKAGDIRIKIVMPNGKTYSDIVIDEFGNLNWRKSFTISETENKDKAGAWKFEISSNKATGFFKISLQTY